AGRVIRGIASAGPEQDGVGRLQPPERLGHERTPDAPPLHRRVDGHELELDRRSSPGPQRAGDGIEARRRQHPTARVHAAQVPRAGDRASPRRPARGSSTPFRGTAWPRCRALTCDLMVTYRRRVTDDDRAFKALADPTRRFLLDRLFERDGRTLTELESELEMTRFGVMKHLRVLADAGLVVTRRSGREKLHFLNPVPVRLIHDRWIHKYAERRVSALADLKTGLEETG